MKKWLKRFAVMLLSLVILLGALLGYAYFIEPNRLVINEISLSVPNFSPQLNGLKIVAVSDIHGGSNRVTEAKIRDIVALANVQNPDIIVLLGDYVSETTHGIPGNLKMPMETIADNLAGFKAKHGVYAVIGNHDWWYDEKKVSRELERVGIEVLNNKTAVVKIGDETVWIWGIEDFWKNRRVPADPFGNITDKRNIVAITHNPDSLLMTPPGISVMIAGHSHGGQVNFPIFGARAFVNDPRFMAGEAVVDDKHVFVTTGIGTSILPLRFRVPPEIAVVTLNAAN